MRAARSGLKFGEKIGKKALHAQKSFLSSLGKLLLILSSKLESMSSKTKEKRLEPSSGLPDPAYNRT